MERPDIQHGEDRLGGHLAYQKIAVRHAFREDCSQSFVDFRDWK